jgi:hypothetical protein
VDKASPSLFGAALSIALATLLITLSQRRASFAPVEGRSMIVGPRACASATRVLLDAERRFKLSFRSRISRLEQFYRPRKRRADYSRPQF